MAASLDKCFQSAFYKKNTPLNVGIKPYLPGITISLEHSFVKKMDEWEVSYGKIAKAEMTPPIIRAHPGNPLVVIEGSDGNDYVLHDKSEGGKHFADPVARALAEDFLWDLGEGLAENDSGLPPRYFQTEIMLPTDGTRSQYKYDKEEYEREYSKQRSARLAREQLPKNIKATTPVQIIAEVMKSTMVVETIRQKLGYYDLSTNKRYEFLSEVRLRELLDVDANHLSGTKDICLSPLFIRKIKPPDFCPKPHGNSLTVTTSFDYGFGKLFKESNIWTTRACHPSKFNKGSNVKYLRRVGMACPSNIGVGGTFALSNEDIAQRDQILQNNQEYQRDRMTQAGKQAFEKRQTYAVGHLNLVRDKQSGSTTEKASPAHFLLFSRTKLDHRLVLPLVLMCEMIKSELVTFLTLLHIIAYQMKNPHSFRFENDTLEPGEATVIAYQRLVETLFPCKPWWGDGTIVSGERWKMSTMSLFSFKSTALAPKIMDVREALGIDEADDRTKKVFQMIQEQATNGNKPYMFLPVMESKSLVFTNQDAVFSCNNARHILKEKEVNRFFEMRDKRKQGPFPLTVVSAVVSLGAYEINERSSHSRTGCTRVRMTADLQQPNGPLLKAETIRVFSIARHDDAEQEPDYPVKIQGYLESLRISAFRNQTLLTRDNIEEYLEPLALSPQEEEDVIQLLVQEEAQENEDSGRWRKRDDVGSVEDDASLPKKARVEGD